MLYHPSWEKILDIRGEEFTKIAGELLKANEYCPNPRQIFRPFLVDPADVKVIIIGQDPYPDPKHANGIAFSTDQEKTPYSLQRFILEIDRSMLAFPPIENFDNTLSHWVEQGVLLLNKSWTVEVGKPGSHEHIWNDYVKNVIARISYDMPGRVWGLLGAKAQSLENTIDDGKFLNMIVKAAHPAADRYGNKFFGSDFFKKINEYLEIQNKKKIEWY